MSTSKVTAPEAIVTTTDEPSLLDSVIAATKQTEPERAQALLRALTEQALDGTVKFDRNLTVSINKAIEAIDAKISEQLAAIMHDPKFAKLEGAWRGLRHLVFNTETSVNLKIRVLNLSKRELWKDMAKSVEFDQSTVFKAIYENEFGTPGGEPYGCLVGDYEFSNSFEDMELLQGIAGVSAAAFAPFIAAASPHLFELFSGSLFNFSMLRNRRVCFARCRQPGCGPQCVDAEHRCFRQKRARGPGDLMRAGGRFVQNLSLSAALAILSIGVAEAQQNPIVSATQAPPPVAAGAFGPTVYPYSPYGYSPYGAGGGYPYQSYNPSTQSLSNNSSQPTMPGQFNLPINQQGGGGGGGQGGQGGGGQGGQGGGSQGASAAGGNPAVGASYDITQNPSSPLYKRYERNSVTDPQLRPKVLSQIGRGKGIRHGFIEEAARLRASIEGQAAARLDARYDFTRQMIGSHLVPPVIGEARNVEQRNGDSVLYLTVGSYQIVRPARLVITPPNWRDYLYIETAEPQTAISALAPDTPDEQRYYDAAYDSGVEKGVEEARQTFDDNLNRLERDYSGMERYHELEHQGAVSLPVVNDQRRAVRVADNGQRAFVGEQVVTLRITPRFKATRKGAYR